MRESISRYKVLKTLGQGAIGVVYLCRDERLDRDVAIKVLSEQYSADPMHRQRFLTEARSASALNHPGIVTIHEIGEEEGRDFIVMEYIQGRSLQEWIRENGPLPLKDLLRTAIQLAQALSTAHQAGIVHRDLKPANVVVTQDGQAKLLDFGMARRKETQAPLEAKIESEADIPTMAASYTQPGMILGTPGFMAPEQARGQEADFRSDQFSFGCLLHAMAAGKTPFSGDSVVDVLHSVIHEEPESVDSIRQDLPKELQAVMERCLRKNPEERYEKTSEIVEALEEIKQSLSVSALAQSPAAAARGGRRPSWILPGVLGAAALVLAAAVYFLVLRPSGRDLTKTVRVEDEQGHEIGRDVLTLDHANRVAIVPFSLSPADSSLRWLSTAASELIAWDLFQDYHVNIDPLRDLMGNSIYLDKARKAGYRDLTAIPLPLQREVAEDLNCTHLVTGTMGLRDSTYLIHLDIHDVKNGRVLKSEDLAGPELLPLIDGASLAVRKQLGLPEEHLAEWKDLPIEDLSTSSHEALMLYCKASVAADFERDPGKARGLLRQAVDKDPGFAMALWNLWYLQQTTGSGGPKESAEILGTLMQNMYRLPERVQFAVKAAFFQNQGDSDKALAVLEMWRDLYPYDIRPHEALLLLYRAHGESKKLVATLEQLIKLDPANPDYLLQAGQELQRTGDFGAAREYFDRYVGQYPDDADARLALASLLQTLGDHQEAKVHLERAQLLDPADPKVRVALARCEFDLGDPSVWPETVGSVLDGNLSPDERVEYTLELAEFYDLTGRTAKGRDVCRGVLEEADGQVSPIWSILAMGELARFLARSGDEEAALATLEELNKPSYLMYGPLIILPRFDVSMELGRLEEAEAAAARMQAAIDASNLELLRFKWMEEMGRIREEQGDLEAACDFFRQRAELSPSGTTAPLDLGRCYRKLGRIEEAREWLQLALLRSPYDPKVLYQNALAADAAGERDRALMLLRRALSVWAEADSTYKPAQEARGLLENWEQGA